MASVKVRMGSNLEPFAGDHHLIDMTADTLPVLFTGLAHAFPDLVNHAFDAWANPLRFIIVSVNGRVIPHGRFAGTSLRPGDTVAFRTAIAGG